MRRRSSTRDGIGDVLGLIRHEVLVRALAVLPVIVSGILPGAERTCWWAATGLIDQRGRPVRGLPPKVVSAAACDAEAAWRGAFLAHGSLTEPGRSSALEITCPGPEAALALVGAARRLHIQVKAREVRGIDRVASRMSFGTAVA